MKSDVPHQSSGEVLDPNIGHVVPLFASPLFIYEEYTDPEFVFDTMHTQKHMLVQQIGGNAISKDNFLLDDESYSMIRRRIEEGLEKYVRDVLRIGVRHQFHITQSWLNVNPTGTHHHLHAHLNAIISGTYYIDVGDSGGIVFTNQRRGGTVTNNGTLVFDIDEQNLFNAVDVPMPARNNDIMFWPAQVPHQVYTNNTNRNRVSLSFNVWTSGEMGTLLGMTHLRL